MNPYRKPGRKLRKEDLPPRPGCYCQCSVEQQWAFAAIFAGPHTKECLEWQRLAEMLEDQDVDDNGSQIDMGTK